jgi:hypothetical protein
MNVIFDFFAQNTEGPLGDKIYEVKEKAQLQLSSQLRFFYYSIRKFTAW